MRTIPHLTFNGQCREAFQFYKELFGGELELFTYGESPLSKTVTADWHDKIIHASLRTNSGVELAGADIRTEEFAQPQGFYVLVEYDEPTEGQRIFEALARDGAIQMPLQETFWSVGFGMVVDRFGTPWELSCSQSP